MSGAGGAAGGGALAGAAGGGGGPQSSANKVFIQRDYTEGTAVRFQTKFPLELERFIDRHQFENTVSTLNNFYRQAEKMNSSSFCEGCLACISAYLLYLCMETHYEKYVKQAASFIDHQNETIYVPRGLYITDPLERGLRVIEITLLDARP